MNSHHTPVESGSTGEWKLRMGIFLAMCTAFSLWFAYDGLIGYPRKNLASVRKILESTRQTAPQAELRANPAATEERLRALAERAAAGPLPLSELRAALGPPTLDQPRTYTFLGAETRAIVELSDGKVLSIHSQPITDPQSESAPNPRITPKIIERISPDMTEQELERFLGQPSKREPRQVWYAGPAAYASFEVDEAGNAGKPAFRKLEPSEGDIFIQKVLAVVLGILSVFIAIKWIRIVTLRVRVDESGLTFNRLHIPWDSMTALDTDRYLDKGWVDLVYTADGREELQRLDSYHIARFREVVQAICERKGFILPTPAAAQVTQNDDVDSNVV